MLQIFGTLDVDASGCSACCCSHCRRHTDFTAAAEAALRRAAGDRYDRNYISLPHDSLLRAAAINWAGNK